MQFRSPLDPWGPTGKAKLSYVHYIISQGEAKLHISNLTSVFHCLPSVGPKQLCALVHLGCTRKELTHLWIHAACQSGFFENWNASINEVFGVKLIRKSVLDTKSAMSLKGITMTLEAKYEISIASQCQNIKVPKKSKLNNANCAAGFDGKMFQPRIVNVLQM